MLLCSCMVAGDGYTLFIACVSRALLNMPTPITASVLSFYSKHIGSNCIGGDIYGARISVIRCAHECSVSTPDLIL